MPEGMEGVQLRVETHFSKPELEPRIVLVVQDRSEYALVRSGLEQGGIGTDVLLTNDLFQGENGADRAQLRALIVLSQRDFLNALGVLDSLRFKQLKKDPLNTLEFDVLDIPPAKEPDRVDILVRLGDQRRGSEHREEID